MAKRNQPHQQHPLEKLYGATDGVLFGQRQPYFDPRTGSVTEAPLFLLEILAGVIRYSDQVQ